MRVCRAYQVPHSTFLGWAKPDRDKAIWEWVRSQRTCPGCGTRAEEWDPAHGGHPAAYHAELEHCPGCLQMQSLRATLSDRDPAEVRGYHVRLVRSEGGRRGRATAA